VEFPELRPADGLSPCWSFERVDGTPPERETTPLGEETIYGDVSARLYRHDNGLRIVVDDTGTFDIADDNATITGYPIATAWDDFVRAHVMGRVLATVLHVAGALTLHGSTVAIGGRAVTFLAPKHHGKTTLALALTASGAELMSDDAVPVEVESRAPVARPGVHSMRADPDVATSLVGADKRPLTREGKALVDLPSSWIRETPTELDAVYLLVPASFPDDRTVAHRNLLQGPDPVIGLLAHTKIGAMLGGWGGQQLLDRAATLASKVPVYRLAVAHDLDLMPQVVQTIGEWHGASLTWLARRAEAGTLS
jgi:hypothetical protein